MRSLVAKSCVLSVLTALFVPAAAEAGPLLDWIKERCNRSGNANSPSGLMATSGSFTAAPTTLMPGQCKQTCLQTCQKVTVNYVPYTDYRTTWQRVPITQYKPVTSTDPQTGCVTTCMRPCTDYQWQLQRIPYTTYRPVYQTQNYQVPVTTITNDCGVSGGCTTCGVPGSGMSMSGANYYSSPGIAPAGAGGTMVPADNIPMLGSQYPALADPYAQTRTQAYRPTFPPSPVGSGLSNPYANSNAYSGMSTPSGYQPPVRRALPQPYYPPVPSGFAAPQPEMNAPAGSAGSERAGSSVLDNFSLQSPGDRRGTPREVPNLPAPQAWQDPSPSRRWEYNTPPANSPADQTVHRDVQQKWAYNPVRLASYVAGEEVTSPSQPASATLSGHPESASATFGAIDFGRPLESGASRTPVPSRSQPNPEPHYNSQWN